MNIKKFKNYFVSMHGRAPDVDGSLMHGVVAVLWCAVGVRHVGLVFEPTKQTACTDTLLCELCRPRPFDLISS
jgi:hypothetical protein